MLGRIALLPVPVGQRTWFDFVVRIGLQRVELRPAEALSKRVRTGGELRYFGADRRSLRVATDESLCT